MVRARVTPFRVDATTGMFRWPELSIRQKPGGRRGLFAATDIPPGTVIPYLGLLIYNNTNKEMYYYAARVDPWREYSFTVARPKDKGGDVHTIAIPLHTTGKLQPNDLEGRSIAGFVEEPSGRQRTNLYTYKGIWFRDRWSFPGVFYVVMEPIRQGEELLVHYGDGYHRWNYTPSETEADIFPRRDAFDRTLEIPVEVQEALFEAFALHCNEINADLPDTADRLQCRDISGVDCSKQLPRTRLRGAKRAAAVRRRERMIAAPGPYRPHTVMQFLHELISSANAKFAAPPIYCATCRQRAIVTTRAKLKHTRKGQPYWCVICGRCGRKACQFAKPQQ